MIDQFRQVVRRLMRTPLFTAIVLLTLAIGVGANTAIFSVIEGVLLKPLPYPQPDRLIGIWHKAPGISIPELNICPSYYFIDREQNTSFEDVGVYNGDAFTITGQGEPEHIRGLDVTDGTFPLLGVHPSLGRLFTKRDDTAEAPPTAMISYGYWQKKFGSDPNVIGRNINADGKPREIIGVLPRGFQFLDYQDVDLVIPMQWDRSKTKLGNFSYEALARMKPGVTLEQASADIARLIPIANRSFPAPDGFSAKIFEDAHIQPNLHLLKQDVVGDVGKALWVLMGSIGVVLLVACANVANLLLVRVEGRRQELAIRSALGAGYGRIAVDLLIESLTLGMLGSVIGLGIAFGALRLLVAAAPTGLPRIHEIGIDLPVLLFTLGIAVTVSLLIGLIPVLKYAGGAINQDLREGGRGLSQGRERHRIRKALVVMQVALALVLLICSGLMIRTFYALMHVSPGFADPNTVQSFRIFIPEARVPETQRERVVREQKAIIDKLAAIPGVTSVSMTTAVPMSGSSSNDVLYAEDHPIADGKIPPIRRFKYVAPGVFKTLDTPIIAGRDYTWDDELQKQPFAIISENFAREYWGSPANAIGKRIRVASTDDWRQIIGVVRDVYDDGVSKDPPPSVYWPLWRLKFEGQPEDVMRGGALVIRTSRAGSENFMEQARQAVWSIDSDLPLSNVSTLGEFYTKSMARTSFTLVMLVVAASMALLLGIIGIYGVIAYSVSQRTREIGIRMALGAQRPSLTAMFVRQGMLLTVIGAGLGIATAFGVMRLMASLLYHVSPMDPITYGGTTAVILGISWVACYLPSRRAATVDPVHALRAE
ncbi:ABC transporter permease [Acidicapsa dinghuensis]|uniref:ABC transporter permease n=1 Tax=Acidicapsa dinghuensis TaxID=2218256 RepID=A0ABW1EK53_9BACT|nr:ABC transporter permease [Acidicapsa dinghuensis]